MKNTVLFTIRCISNLHAGNGESDDAAIDKMVQRDVATNFPCIHASSLKGAFREYFKFKSGVSEHQLFQWFGSDKNEKENMQQGALRFSDAQLLLFPARGIESPYYLATSPGLVDQLNSSNKDYGVDFTLQLKNLPKVVVAEGVTGEMRSSNLNLFPEFMMLSHEVINTIACDNLPIVARNCLDNGESVNLWYEEFVPRETVFYFYIVNFNMDDPKNNELLTNFVKELDGVKLYIGANNTVGQGYSLISKVA